MKGWIILKEKFIYLFSLLTLSICLMAFENGNQSEEEGTKVHANEESEISVVASFLPMYEFTKAVAGDRADVHLMVSGGADPHQYEPSAQDVAAVNEADVLVYSSEEMEFWVESLLNAVENDNLVVARAADGIDGTQHTGHNHGDEGDHDDTRSVLIQGVSHHYHTGDEIEITAELSEDVDYDHWHWFIREDADEEWEVVQGQGTALFSFEAPEESFEIQAVIYDNDHNVYAESEPVAVIIDNHDHDHGEHAGLEAEEDMETVEIVGVADHYHTGDVVTLVAELSDETDYDHWHWFIRGDADEEWEAVPEQMTNHFEYRTTGDSFEVQAVLYDNDHNPYAQSSPISILIDDHEEQDPHIWLDPVLAQNQVNVIRDALIEADPDGKEIYEENALAFNAELQALDEEYQVAFENVDNRVFVVQHQAFGYLAERYDLEQVAIGGLSTEVEPSPSRIAEIANLVMEYDVPVIYYQQGANSAIAQTVATETGTETAVLYDLEVLSEELLAEDLGYLEAMRANLEALRISIN